MVSMRKVRYASGALSSLGTLLAEIFWRTVAPLRGSVSIMPSIVLWLRTNELYSDYHDELNLYALDILLFVL